MARKKRAGAHGGHGWFVTFADLMALLMSFFVMVAAYSTQDQKKMQMVAGSMRDAFGVNKESKFAGIIESEGLPAADHVKYLRDVPADQATDRTTRSRLNKSSEFGLTDTGEPENFGLAAASLRQALQSLPDFAELSKNVVIARTEQGLDVSIVDQDGRSMFPEGSTRPNERTRSLLEKLGPALRQMPNRIAVTGYTATDRPGRSGRPVRHRRRQGRHRADVPRRPLHAGQPARDGDAAQGGPPGAEREGASVSAPRVPDGSH